MRAYHDRKYLDRLLHDYTVAPHPVNARRLYAAASLMIDTVGGITRIYGQSKSGRTTAAARELAKYMMEDAPEGATAYFLVPVTGYILHTLDTLARLKGAAWVAPRRVDIAGRRIHVCTQLPLANGIDPVAIVGDEVTVPFVRGVRVIETFLTEDAR